MSIYSVLFSGFRVRLPFLGNGNIFSLRGWKHIFIGGMGRNLWGDEYPHPPGFASLKGQFVGDSR